MVTFTCIFVTVTLLLTSLATFFLVLSLHSNEWEYMSYMVEHVEEISQKNNASLEWLKGDIARIEYPEAIADELSEVTNGSKISKARNAVFYLVPAYGGVNKLCTDVPGSIRRQMKEDGRESDICLSYLSNEKVISRDSWLDRKNAKSGNVMCDCLFNSSWLLRAPGNSWIN
ncbi:uncharacterized protein CEXT_159151 [Caerostris extrusa]|uniref:Uncharacterized protein n=1 Tax=Caerostris extrusa TaxID=172846 RepID=A0AAV4SG20_CAEEX|nr:uncharacterized protein CEXT_159151 [Caerostris extrusa]